MPRRRSNSRKGTMGFSSRVMHQAHTYLVPFTMENPEPINEVSIFKMPEVVSVAELREVKDTNFDQCRFGCEARKPTRLLHYGVVLLNDYDDVSIV
jgi:SMC interacting uncharacterized protein involved in chromosome segregation